MDEKFSHVYKHAVRVARNVIVDPTMPRVAGRQIHPCNALTDNPEQYYQRNVAVPLFNHIKAELDEQFSSNEFSGYINLYWIALFSFYVPPFQLVHFFVRLKYWGSSFLWTDLSVLASSLLCLVPLVLCDRAGDLPNADEIVNTYKNDIPSPELLRQELLRFQIRWNIVN